MPAANLDLDTLSEVRFGNTALRVIRTPGHTPGHVALYEPDSKSLFTGDTLFRESIGRTDLPGGDYSWIMRSILDSLIPLVYQFFPIAFILRSRNAKRKGCKSCGNLCVTYGMEIR